jgi:hypothetical protein
MPPYLMPWLSLWAGKAVMVPVPSASMPAWQARFFGPRIWMYALVAE